MKTIALVLLVCGVCFLSGCIWVGSTLTGEMGLYYSSPSDRGIYWARAHSPYRSSWFGEPGPCLRYRMYPYSWRYWR